MIDLQILKSETQSPFYSLSLGYGNGHVVVRLTSGRVVSEIVRLVSAHKGKTWAEWIEIGTFGANPATLYLDKDTINIIVDGDDCGDGSAQSFGVHLPADAAAEFLSAIASESAKAGIEQSPVEN